MVRSRRREEGRDRGRGRETLAAPYMVWLRVVDGKRKGYLRGVAVTAMLVGEQILCCGQTKVPVGGSAGEEEPSIHRLSGNARVNALWIASTGPIPE